MGSEMCIRDRSAPADEHQINTAPPLGYRAVIAPRGSARAMQHMPRTCQDRKCMPKDNKDCKRPKVHADCRCRCNKDRKVHTKDSKRLQRPKVQSTTSRPVPSSSSNTIPWGKLPHLAFKRTPSTGGSFLSVGCIYSNLITTDKNPKN